MPDRFPKPWTILEQEPSIVVVDASGFKIAYLYYETRPAHQLIGDERMTKRQALTIARKIAAIGS